MDGYREWSGTETVQLVAAPVRLVVPYTDPVATSRVLDKAAALTSGIGATVLLLAVQVLPFPAPFYLPRAVHEHLEARLAELVAAYPGAVDAKIVLARCLEDGFAAGLPDCSTVVVGVGTHWWQFRGRSLARLLARQGHEVVRVEA
jgi:hypothetical protein